MIKIFTISLFFLVPSYLFPQWTKIEPFQINYNLYSVSFVDDNTGYASSQFGILAKTTNGGVSWKTLGTVAEEKLNSIYMIKDAYGFAVGENGRIISSCSDSSGNSDLWVNQISGIKTSLNSVYFINNNVGYTAGNGGVILKTINRGLKWNKLSSETTANLYSISFIDEKIGWTAGGSNDKGIILQTSNGGTSWKMQFSKSNLGNLNSIFFIDKSLGWAVGGNGTILRTTNGGTNWLIKNSGTRLSLKSIKFFNKNEGLAAGEKGLILITSNGGETWKIKPNYTENNLQSISISSSGNAWVVGNTGNIFKSSNFGDNWIKQDWLTNFTFKDVTFINNNIGWIIGDPGFIFKTTDAGNSWVQQESNTGYWLNSIYFVDKDNGWITGKSGLENNYDFSAGPNCNVVLKTTDGGENWELQKLNPVDKRFNVYGSLSIQFIDKNNGWISGYASEFGFPDVFPEGVIYKTANGGKTWNPFIVGNTNNISKVHFLDKNAGFCMDGFEFENGGKLLASTNGGDSWYTLNSELISAYDFYFLNKQKGWLSGVDLDYSKVVLSTNDGGQSWEKAILPFSFVPSSINFIDEKNGWIVGKEENSPGSGVFSGAIYNTMDGGITWEKQSSGAIDPLRKISFIENNNSWIIGDNGTIMKYEFSVAGTCTDISYKKGWNLISIPEKVNDMSLNSIFSNSESKAFGLSGQVVETNLLENGKAYWIKIGSAGKKQICGEEVNNSVKVKKGWNLIAPFNKDVPVNQITTTPGGILVTAFYGFDRGFTKVNNLKVGEGYYVKVSSDGYLNYGSNPEEGNRLLAKINDNWGKLRIEDAAGMNTYLYDINGDEVNSDEYEIPPIPPAGIFDARFENGLMVENLGSGSKGLYISSTEYPVKIKAEGSSFKLKYKSNGNTIENIIEDGKEIIIKDKNINFIEVSNASENNVVKEYALLQNYPNPFNPTTKIKFAIAEQGKVNISVYSILGERVAELVNQEMEAGYHEVNFNAGSLSSGIYIYKIQMDKFNAVKKMLLLK